MDSCDQTSPIVSITFMLMAVPVVILLWFFIIAYIRSVLKEGL